MSIEVTPTRNSYRCAHLGCVNIRTANLYTDRANAVCDNYSDRDSESQTNFALWDVQSKFGEIRKLTPVKLYLEFFYSIMTPNTRAITFQSDARGHVSK